MGEEEAFNMLKFLMFDMGLRKQYRPDMIILQVESLPSACDKVKCYDKHVYDPFPSVSKEISHHQSPLQRLPLLRTYSVLALHQVVTRIHLLHPQEGSADPSLQTGKLRLRKVT